MPLTIERAALVRRLAMQGYADDQIADLLRISRWTVLDVKQRAGRHAAIRAASARGMSVKQLAEEFHVAPATIRALVH
jgi:DNA-binding CsgD family transcriptional regulator